MQFDKLEIEPSRDPDSSDVRGILDKLPIEIIGEETLVLKVEMGMSGIFISPITGTVREVRAGEGVERLACDNTFYLGKYEGIKFRITFTGYVPSKPYDPPYA